METTDRVVAFLYLLLRDKLVAGDVEDLVNQATEQLQPGPVRLVNPHLAALATDYAERLAEASAQPKRATLEAERAEKIGKIFDGLAPLDRFRDVHADVLRGAVAAGFVAASEKMADPKTTEGEYLVRIAQAIAIELGRRGVQGVGDQALALMHHRVVEALRV